MTTAHVREGRGTRAAGPLYVHIQRRMTPEHREWLEDGLLPGIQVTDGDSPASPSTEILVAGLPVRAEISALAGLHALIVPWASIPKATRLVLEEFPELSVHNLHHNAASTAELAITLALAAAKRVIPVDRALRERDWQACLDPAANLLLDGLAAVVLGYGAVGKRVARACVGLGMQVIAVRRHPSTLGSSLEGVEVRSSEALGRSLREAQVLIITLPLTDETIGMIGPDELELLPRGALLVNVARAEIVDEEGLYEALRRKRLAAAGIDVWHKEPSRAELERGDRIAVSRFSFETLDNLVMSPHRGGALGVERNERRRFDELASLLNAAALGNPMPNRVSRDLWY